VLYVTEHLVNAHGLQDQLVIVHILHHVPLLDLDVVYQTARVFATIQKDVGLKLLGSAFVTCILIIVFGRWLLRTDRGLIFLNSLELYSSNVFIVLAVLVLGHALVALVHLRPDGNLYLGV
jgi:hypothetical protein